MFVIVFLCFLTTNRVERAGHVCCEFCRRSSVKIDLRCGASRRVMVTPFRVLVAVGGDTPPITRKDLPPSEEGAVYQAHKIQ